jgi:hypothetical protein
VELYPNPGNNNFKVKISQKSQGLLIITDLNGKELKNVAFNSDNIELNLAELVSGTYFVKITISSEKHILKLIKI